MTTRANHFGQLTEDDRANIVSLWKAAQRFPKRQRNGWVARQMGIPPATLHSWTTRLVVLGYLDPALTSIRWLNQGKDEPEDEPDRVTNTHAFLKNVGGLLHTVKVSDKADSVVMWAVRKLYREAKEYGYSQADLDAGTSLFVEAAVERGIPREQAEEQAEAGREQGESEAGSLHMRSGSDTPESIVVIDGRRYALTFRRL